MKSKKIAMAIVAITMSATTALAFTACNNGGSNSEKEHDWQYTVSATDSTKHVVHCNNENHEGENDTLEAHTWGTDDKCTKCDAAKPAEQNPGGEHTHAYGDWKVTAPTENGNGEAVKVCANDAEHEHDIKVTLPSLKFGNYAITEDDNAYTYSYTDKNNGKITFKVDKVEAQSVKFTVGESDIDADMGFAAKEVEFTPTETRTYQLSLAIPAVSDDENEPMVEVWESKEAYDEYEPSILSNGRFGNDLTESKTLTAGTAYKFYVTTEKAGEYALNISLPKPLMAEEVSGLGDIKATVEADENKYYMFSGKPNTNYVFKFAEGTQNNPAIYRVNRTSNLDFKLSAEESDFTFFDNSEYSQKDDNYLVLRTNNNGYVYFCVNSAVAGEYTLKVEDFVAIPATAIEVKDAEGNEVSEYTIYINEEDKVLLGFVDTLPHSATDKNLTVEIEKVKADPSDPDSNEITIAEVVETGTFSMNYLRGVTAGETKLIIINNKGKENELRKEITLHVERRVTSINIGDTIFDTTSNVEGHLDNLVVQEMAYGFTGEANTDYYVTFKQGSWGYSWTIKDASDEENYINKFDTKITYIKVTTDADGKATLLISGNAVGTLNISTEQPADVGGGDEEAKKDGNGRYELEPGENSGIKITGSNYSNTYCVIYGEANTEYKVTLSEAALSLDQCDEMNEWLVDDGNHGTINCVVTTDDEGTAYIRFALFSDVTISITVEEKGPYDEDEHGHLILKAGDNAGLVTSNNMNTYYAFKGDANYNYTVTLSQEVFFVDGCDSAGEWLDSDHDKKTCVITTDADGIAHIRVTSFSTITDLTISIVKGEEVTPEPEGIVLNVTVTADDLNMSSGYYSVDVKFTPTVTGIYKFSLSAGDIFISRDAYGNGWGDPIDGSCLLTANTEYTFVFSMSMGPNAVGTHTVTLTPPADTSDPTPDPAPELTAVDMTATGSATVTIEDDAEFDNEDEMAYFRAFTFTPAETGTYTITLATDDRGGRAQYSVFTKENFDKYYDMNCDNYYDYPPFIESLQGNSADITLTAGTEYTFIIVVHLPGEHTLSAVKKVAE